MTPSGLQLLPAALALLALSPLAASQRYDIVLDVDRALPGIGQDRSIEPLAVSAQGVAAAFITGSEGAGLVVDGQVVALRSSTVTSSSIGERPHMAFNGAGRLAWSASRAVGSGARRVVVDGVEVLVNGDPTGTAGVTWRIPT
ncbi:MAG: hypothetical protein AAGG01_15845, partial [Planctomycetota bacterium]